MNANKGGRPRKLQAQEPMVSGPELCAILQVTQKTINRWLHAAKIPAPDLVINRQTYRWRRSTLERAGIAIPPSPPTPAK